MTALDRSVGRALMAVRHDVDATRAPGAVEFFWDDRSTLRVESVGPRLALTQFPFRKPSQGDKGSAERQLAARAEGRARHDVSRSAPFDRLIGQVLTGLRVADALVVLEFGGSRVEMSLSGADLLVTVTHPNVRREWWRVEWRHDDPDDPVEILCEVVDDSERRKVEVWRDGRLGWASAFVAFGGTGLTNVPSPSLDEVNADPQFHVLIDAATFEDQWQLALAGCETTTLWRPTGPAELARVEESGWRRWPGRLPDQPIFYPVTSSEYAERIAREWNVPNSGVGYVTKFRVVTDYMARYDIHEAGGSALTEWWVPAEELDDLNDHIVGQIEVMAEVQADG